MAKRKVQDETQELPTVTVEVAPDLSPHTTITHINVEIEDCYIYNPDTSEMRCLRVRAGYAPAPMGFGFRLATADEIADYLATQEG